MLQMWGDIWIYMEHMFMKWEIQCFNTVQNTHNKHSSLKTVGCHSANFVVIAGTGGCHYDNLPFHRWQQSLQHDNSWFWESAIKIRGVFMSSKLKVKRTNQPYTLKLDYEFLCTWKPKIFQTDVLDAMNPTKNWVYKIGNLLQGEGKPG